MFIWVCSVNIVEVSVAQSRWKILKIWKFSIFNILFGQSTLSRLFKLSLASAKTNYISIESLFCHEFNTKKIIIVKALCRIQWRSEDMVNFLSEVNVRPDFCYRLYLCKISPYRLNSQIILQVQFTKSFHVSIEEGEQLNFKLKFYLNNDHSNNPHRS